jgi:hypothetical protein
MSSHNIFICAAQCCGQKKKSVLPAAVCWLLMTSHNIRSCQCAGRKSWRAAAPQVLKLQGDECNHRLCIGRSLGKCVTCANRSVHVHCGVRFLLHAEQVCVCVCWCHLAPALLELKRQRGSACWHACSYCCWRLACCFSCCTQPCSDTSFDDASVVFGLLEALRVLRPTVCI